MDKKIYTLCADMETIKVLTNRDEAHEKAKELLKELNKLNDKDENYYYGNVHILGGSKITYHKYKKVSSTVSSPKAIDDLVMKYKNMEELKKAFKFPRRDLCIVYRYRDIRTLPLIYSDASDLLDDQTLCEEYESVIGDDDFIEFFLKDKHISSSIKGCEDEYDAIRKLSEDRNNHVTDERGEDQIEKFYKKFATNYFRKRMLICLMMDYINMKNKQKKEETKAKESIFIKEEKLDIYDQTDMFEYAEDNGYKLK